MRKHVGAALSVVLAVSAGIFFWSADSPSIHAWLTDRAGSENRFVFANRKPRLIDEYVEDTWEPGERFEKNVSVRNDGTVACYPRIKIQFSDSKVEPYCILYMNQTDWSYDAEEGWYYYTHRLEPGKRAENLLTEVWIMPNLPENLKKDFDIFVSLESLPAPENTVYTDVWRKSE